VQSDAARCGRRLSRALDLRQHSHPQVSEVKSTLNGQLLDPVQPDIARALKVLDCQPAIVGILPDLIDSLPDRPLWVESWHLCTDLREVDLIVPCVGTCAIRKRDWSARDLADLLSDCPDLHDVLVPTHIEGLVVNQVTGGLENGEERPGNVLDVHQRSPRAAIGLEPYAALSECSPRQVVDYDVGPQPRRGSVCCGVP
jgi:hypothetical protein